MTPVIYALLAVVAVLIFLLAMAGFIIYRLTVILAERPIITPSRTGTPNIVRHSVKEPEYDDNLADKKDDKAKKRRIPLGSVTPDALMKAVSSKPEAE